MTTPADVWNHGFNATSSPTNGTQIPAETAGDRLREMRKHTAFTAAQTVAIVEDLQALAGAVESVSAQVETLRRIVVDTHPNPYGG